MKTEKQGKMVSVWSKTGGTKALYLLRGKERKLKRI
jgi:hypothetical protein